MRPNLHMDISEQFTIRVCMKSQLIWIYKKMSKKSHVLRLQMANKVGAWAAQSAVAQYQNTSKPRDKIMYKANLL